MGERIIGYLVWSRTMRGEATASKHDKDTRDGGMPETKKRQEEETIGTPIPLTEAEWAKTLGELIAQHPCPPRGGIE